MQEHIRSGFRHPHSHAAVPVKLKDFQVPTAQKICLPAYLLFSGWNRWLRPELLPLLLSVHQIAVLSLFSPSSVYPKHYFSIISFFIFPQTYRGSVPLLFPFTELDPFFIRSFDNKESHTLFPEWKFFNSIRQHFISLLTDPCISSLNICAV